MLERKNEHEKELRKAGLEGCLDVLAAFQFDTELQAVSFENCIKSVFKELPKFLFRTNPKNLGNSTALEWVQLDARHELVAAVNLFLNDLVGPMLRIGEKMRVDLGNGEWLGIAWFKYTSAII